MAIIYLLPRLTKAVPSSLAGSVAVSLRLRPRGVAVDGKLVFGGVPGRELIERRL